MHTLIDLAKTLDVDVEDLIALIDGDPTGTDYVAGPDPHGRLIDTTTGRYSNHTLTTEGLVVLALAVTSAV